ncbi:MAG: DUF5667 domain-containing protein [Chloroflexota bacterium]
MERVTIQDALDYCLANPDDLGVEELLDKFPEYRDQLGPLLGLASRFETLVPPAIPVSRRDAIKSRVVAAAEAAQAARRVPLQADRKRARSNAAPRPIPWYLKPGWVVAAVAAVLVAFVWWSSATALPDSLFYNVKLAGESISLNLTGSPADKIRRHTSLANSRLYDLRTMQERSKLADAKAAFDNYSYNLSSSVKIWDTLTGEPRVELARILYVSSVAGKTTFASFATAVRGLPTAVRETIASTELTLSTANTNTAQVLAAANIDLASVLDGIDADITPLLTPVVAAALPVPTNTTAGTEPPTDGPPTITANAVLTVTVEASLATDTTTPVALETTPADSTRTTISPNLTVTSLPITDGTKTAVPAGSTATTIAGATSTIPGRLTPTVTGTGTPVRRLTATPGAIGSLTVGPGTPLPVGTQGGILTPTRTAQPPQSTYTPLPPGATPIPVDTPSNGTPVVPTHTSTPPPGVDGTNTPVPVVPTDTIVPPAFTPTSVPPVPTSTFIVPVPTDTSVPPTPTDTSVPTPTDTSVPPTPTNTSVPTPTDTSTPPLPTPTDTSVPATPTPTDTSVPTPTATMLVAATICDLHVLDVGISCGAAGCIDWTAPVDNRGAASVAADWTAKLWIKMVGGSGYVLGDTASGSTIFPVGTSSATGSFCNLPAGVEKFKLEFEIDATGYPCPPPRKQTVVDNQCGVVP